MILEFTDKPCRPPTWGARSENMKETENTC